MNPFGTRVDVGRVQVHATQFARVVQALCEVRERPIGSVRLVNAWCVVIAEDDSTYRDVVNGPGLTLPDGAPVVAVMRRTPAGSTAERVRGPSLFEAVLDQGRSTQLRHFLLGGAPETATSLSATIAERYPGTVIDGSWAPPFAALDEAMLREAVDRVTASNADVVWVGLGAPKQDLMAQEIALRTGVTAVGVGAAFDFLAGTVREAPVWVQRSGLEWLFRLAAEPRRLWRRYLVGNFRFLRIVGLR